MAKALWMAFVLMLVTGCATPGAKETYDVEVINKLKTPITVWLTKDSPPYEDGWAPPEAVVPGGSNDHDRLWGGVVIKPGLSRKKTFEGNFSGDQTAVLRIYRATDLDQILAISRGSDNRVDLHMEPGFNHFLVSDEEGKLTVLPVPPPGAKVEPPH